MSRITRNRHASEDDDSKKERNYLLSSFTGIFIIWIAKTWWPEVYPAGMEVFGAPFWNTRGTVSEWLSSVWPVFAWGIGFNIILHWLRSSRFGRHMDRMVRARSMTHVTPREIMVGGTLISVWAGVVEELCFRWILYLSAIPSLIFGNWLFGTFFSYIIVVMVFIGMTSVLRNTFAQAIVGVTGIVAVVAMAIHGGFLDPIGWLYQIILLPVVDFTSLGKLTEFLYPNVSGPDGWAVGAALVSANLFFRDGHKYQKFMGWANSWFVGLVFFWVMFTYGLVPAMLVHFLYDFLIFTWAAIHTKMNRGF